MAKSKSNKNEEKSQIDAVAMEPPRDKFLIVGLGASAGGIQAFHEFFQHVPSKSGIAYVVILHLSPDHDSNLAHVLQQVTKMPVTQVNEKVKVQTDHVYVVPPNQHLTMEDGSIIVSPNTQIEERRAPVDIFFRTLADEHGSNAVCVILSGTGANGSMGLKRVKEQGGATFVQNPREAEFNEMPRNAIATGLVDEVLPVADIPAKILAYKNSLGKVQISEDSEKRPQDQQQAIREIFTEIRVRTGHDFSNYKRPTLLRRIERRINIHNLPDLPSYVSYMHQNPDETNALLKDLLISVTNFFRDKKAFEVIEKEVLPLMLKGKKSENQLRIWVAGCATGEEAYSLAMLCAEKTTGVFDAPKIQIFATDIDEAAIATAREGLFNINDLADVSPERLRRFFTKEGEEYRIRREIRETIMFANHNFLKDPPFSHLDMISCRNVMIYLNHVAQERVTETFHFALNPGGFLFLGSSESVDGATDLYANYNRENHIFQSRQATTRAYPIPESIPSFRIDKQPLTSAQEQENKVLERISFGDLHQQLLEQYGPPSLVVNEEYDIVHLTERAGRYLQIGGGDISQNLLKLVRPELRLELRSALYQAVQRQSAVETRGLKINIDNHPEVLNIHVRPVLRQGDTARGFLLVLFETSTNKDDEKEIVVTSDEPMARHLEEELIRLKTQLRSSNEQHEFQQEELKASNEELQAMNEELRSAAEELETSKEELQSINEELRTVNQELKVKIEETTLTNNNLQNLINSTDIGTIFLDRGFRVALFTPAVRNIFNLIPADYGRLLSDITNKLEYAGLLHDAEAVLQKLTTVEHELKTTEGQVFLMRMSPYRTTEDRINGVVITFVDITERKRAAGAIEEDLKATQTLQSLATKLVSAENFEVLYDEVMAAAISITNADAGTVQILDEKTKELMLLATRGFSKETMQHFARIDAGSNTSCGAALARGERSFVDFDDPDAADEDGSLKMHVQEGYLSAQSTPLTTRSGKTIGMISTHWKKHLHRPTQRELRYLDLLARQAADIIEQRLAAKELHENMDELTRFNQAMVSRELRMVELKKEVNELCGNLGKPPRYALDFINEENRT
jgi:two-component system CheB/CheR fusion protein